MVVRIDGRGFTKFCKAHDFKKPNDKRALDLMNCCALQILNDFPDIVLAFGESDEYSFLFKRKSKVFNRRRSKITSSIVSLFSACYVFHWNEFIDTPLKQVPQFDGRLVLYPNDQVMRDYFRWRQADCHINNLYNTTLWNLVLKGNLTLADATEELKGTLSKDKNEILFSKFQINYNNEPEIFRKGSVALQMLNTEEKRQKKAKFVPEIYHIDIMKDGFWEKLNCIK